MRYPKLFKRWTVFANHCLFKSSLDDVARELAILRIAWLTQAEYEWGQHVLIARGCGVADAAISRVKDGANASGWTSDEAAILTAVDQLHADCGISDSCWQDLRQTLNEKQVLDLIFTVGNYRMLATFMRSVDVARDAGVPGLDEP